MLLADAERLALELMGQFGLLPNWTFEFDNSLTNFGCCRPRGYSRYMGGRFVYHREGGKITLSRELTLRNGRDQVEDTIRHEIAHALTPTRRECPSGLWHGPEWKANCAKTGARPVRCYSSDEVDAPKGDWSATCGVCGEVHYRFRQPKGDRWCLNKECLRMAVPYIPGDKREHPMRKLAYRHRDAIIETPQPTKRREAVEAVKAQLRGEEPGLVYQCAKCDRRSISYHAACPLCGGDMVEEKKLAAEKEALKRKIAELESEARK